MLDVEGFVHRNFNIITQYGNPVSDLRVNCPFCDDGYGKVDRKQKLYISLNKQVVHCFRCGYKANWVQFVRDVLKCSYHRAFGELYRKPNPKDINKLFTPKDIVTKRKKVEIDIPIVGLWEEKGCKYLSAGRKYAEKRGLTREQWLMYNLSVSNELEYRLVIPIEEQYYQARAFYGFQSPKYLNPKVPSDAFIFNSGALHVYEEVVICEGAISAMHVGLNAVAVLGSDISNKKLDRLLSSSVERYVLVSEPNTERQAVQIADKLIRGRKDVIIWKYLVGDPADPDSSFKKYEYTFKNKLRLLW